MKRRLSVEQHNVSVNQMSVDNVAFFEIECLWIHVSQTECIAILLDVDRLCTWMCVWTIANISNQSFPIVWTDDFRKRQVNGNLFRHTEFVQLNVCIRCNDRSCREVYTLSHQVTTHSSCLGSKTRLECAQRTTGSLLGRRHSLDVVVHIGCDVVLQQGSQLVNHIG